jgi:hypothetical protein
MRESRTYGSGRGACDETHVPTATVRPVCVCRQWRKKPPGELSIDPVADERLGWVTTWVGAS